MKGIIGSTKKRQDIREKIEEIILKYKSGTTAQKIADEFKISKSIILTLLRPHVFMRKSAPLKGRIPWNKGLNRFTDKRILKYSGEKNVNWKGGVTPLNMKVRRCKKYIWWTKAIFQRDNWTCVSCKKRGGDLEADHYPKLFCEIMKTIFSLEEATLCDELWNLNNGRTLCLSCHNKTKSFKFWSNK